MTGTDKDKSMNMRKKYYATIEIEADVSAEIENSEQAGYINMLLNQMNHTKVSNESGWRFYIQRMNNLFITDQKGKLL